MTLTHLGQKQDSVSSNSLLFVLESWIQLEYWIQLFQIFDLMPLVSLYVSIFSWEVGTGVAPYVQQGDVKPVKGDYFVQILAENKNKDVVSKNFIYKENYYYRNLQQIPLDQRLLDPSGNPIPDEYDPRMLTLLSRHQVAFWDETYPKVVISTGKIKNLQNKNVEVKFSQNKEGNFNITSYRYAKPREKSYK